MKVTPRVAALLLGAAAATIIAIQVVPPAVTRPRIWGPSSSPLFLLDD